MTVPKLRDYVNSPNDRYKEIMSQSTKNIDTLSKNDMQDELKDFLNNIKQESPTYSDEVQSAGDSLTYTSY